LLSIDASKAGQSSELIRKTVNQIDLKIRELIAEETGMGETSARTVKFLPQMNADEIDIN
jgi:hypothetical protein